MTPIEVAQLKPFPIHFELNKHNIQYIDTMNVFIYNFEQLLVWWKVSSKSTKNIRLIFKLTSNKFSTQLVINLWLRQMSTDEIIPADKNRLKVKILVSLPSTLTIFSFERKRFFSKTINKFHTRGLFLYQMIS